MSATAPAPRTEVRIRLLRPDDLPRVLEIEVASFSTPWRVSTFRGLLRRADTDLLAAEQAGCVVGYAVAWTVTDQAEVGNVAVAEEARGLGIGRLLVQAMMERLARRGAAECFLEVRESNHTARNLYHSEGFEVIGRRAAYYSQPTEDALVMRRMLSGSA